MREGGDNGYEFGAILSGLKEMNDPKTQIGVTYHMGIRPAACRKGDPRRAGGRVNENTVQLGGLH